MDYRDYNFSEFSVNDLLNSVITVELGKVGHYVKNLLKVCKGDFDMNINPFIYENCPVLSELMDKSSDFTTIDQMVCDYLNDELINGKYEVVRQGCIRFNR